MTTAKKPKVGKKPAQNSEAMEECLKRVAEFLASRGRPPKGYQVTSKASTHNENCNGE